jgi:hypothetical protein
LDAGARWIGVAVIVDAVSANVHRPLDVRAVLTGATWRVGQRTLASTAVEISVSVEKRHVRSDDGVIAASGPVAALLRRTRWRELAASLFEAQAAGLPGRSVEVHVRRIH